MEKLLSFLDAIHPLTPGLREHLIRILKQKEFKRKDFLLKAGHVCRNIYFIEKGLVRSFYMLGDKDISAWFMKEGDVIVSILSFFGQQPSQESIQALEDTTVHYVNFDELEHMYERFPSFNVNGRKLLTHYYQLSEQRSLSMRAMKAKERFDYFLAHEGYLLQRVARKYISSYLGLTETTLSNIGNGELKKNHETKKPAP